MSRRTKDNCSFEKINFSFTAKVKLSLKIR